MVILFLIFQETVILLSSKWLPDFNFPPTVHMGSRPCQHLLLSGLVLLFLRRGEIAILMDVKWNHCSFDFYFPND